MPEGITCCVLYSFSLSLYVVVMGFFSSANKDTGNNSNILFVCLQQELKTCVCAYVLPMSTELRWPLTAGFIHAMAIIVLRAVGDGPINFMLLAGLVGGGLFGAASLWRRSSAFADGLLLGEREADLRESLKTKVAYHMDPYCDRPGAGADE